jgi:hypothetical protein
MDAASRKRVTGADESGRPADVARRPVPRLHTRRMAAALVAGITALVLLTGARVRPQHITVYPR